MLKISNVKIKADVKVNKEILAKKVAKILRVSANAIKDLSIVKKSIDARDKENVFYLFSLKVDIENEDRYLKLKDVSKYKEISYAIPENKCINSPVVVGFGPAGMFASLLLARAGAKLLYLKEVRLLKTDRLILISSLKQEYLILNPMFNLVKVVQVLFQTEN